MTYSDAIALGDLNVDWTVAGLLPLAWEDLVDSGATVLQEISEQPGGGAFTFAKAARRSGIATTILGAVGSDAAGAWLLSKVAELGADSLVVTIPDKSTGKCFMARDRKDIRFLVNTLENANHFLGVSHLEPLRERVLGARVVHVPGFCLRDPRQPRYAAVKQIFDWISAKTAPPALVFDVVPHRIYELMTWETFRALCRPVQVLTSEVSTMRRFLGLGHRDELLTLALAEETLTHLKPLFPRLVLRFGPSGCDHELRWDGRAGRSEYVDDTGHSAAADKRGFGDILTVSALKDFFQLL